MKNTIRTIIASIAIMLSFTATGQEAINRTCHTKVLTMEEACPIKTNAYGLESAQRTITSANKEWSDTDVITFSFEYGSDEDKDHVRTAVQMLYQEVPELETKLFEVEHSGTLRIAFDPRLGAWSYVGTDNRFIPDSQPTMNIGWFEPTYTTTIHEFLHALGFYHEHTHPMVDYDWDGLYDYFLTEHGWDRDMVDNNFKTDVDAIYGTYDPESIMHYWIRCQFVLSGSCEQDNKFLSGQDIQRLKEMYGSPDETPVPVTETVQCYSDEYIDVLKSKDILELFVEWNYSMNGDVFSWLEESGLVVLPYKAQRIFGNKYKVKVLMDGDKVYVSDKYDTVSEAKKDVLEWMFNVDL